MTTPTPTSTPTRYGLILFPGFQALDVFGPLDALNTLSHSQNITLELIAKTLDPVSTQVRDPIYNPANSTFAQSILPTTTFATIAAHSYPLDVLIVPGGLGTRPSSPSSSSTNNNDKDDDNNHLKEEVAFIKAIYPKLHFLLTVCTGAGLAARAGVLDHKKATTNKSVWWPTTALGPKVKWITHARWVVDGNVWTSSGVSAGIDLIFAWIEAVYGSETATEVANILEYERHTDSRWDPFADLYGLPPNDDDTA